MLHRPRLGITARTWCSSTAPASWTPGGRRAGWVASSTPPPNCAACRHSTSCWHTDPGSSRSSTSRSERTPTRALTSSMLLYFHGHFAARIHTKHTESWKGGSLLSDSVQCFLNFLYSTCNHSNLCMSDPFNKTAVYCVNVTRNDGNVLSLMASNNTDH